MSSSNKRQRDLARAKYERQQSRKHPGSGHKGRTQKIAAVVVVVVLVLGAVAWVLTNRSNTQPTATALDVANCTGDTTTTTTPKTFAQAPKVDPEIADRTELVLSTNCGPIVIETLSSLAPATVTSELFLANKGFYNQTPCHRLTTSGIYVLQCGDPTGTSKGGPGYSVPDENLPTGTGVNYPAGTVAMANAGPGTSGSQFFLVYRDTTLPPNYTIWGKVTTGLDLLQQIANAGVSDGSGDGAPAQPVVIEQATVRSA